MRGVVSDLFSGLFVHRVHLPAIPPQGHPRQDPAVCEIRGRCARADLPLAELEPLPRAGTAGLLPFDRAGIASQQSRGPELDAVLPIGLDERAGDAQPQRAGLARLSAAIHMCPHIERAERVGGGEGLLDVLHERRARKVVAEVRPLMSHLPVPGVRYTRATLVLRRPTACQRNWGTTVVMRSPSRRKE